MQNVKWHYIKQQLPESRKIVWVGHYRTRNSQLGYYTSESNAFFNLDGTGIVASHWAEIINPEPPTALDGIY